MAETQQVLLLRRSRAAVDGPFPVFSVMSGKKVPLSAAQNAALLRQSLVLAEQPSLTIRSTIFEMLEADRQGVQHHLEICGLMKAKVSYQNKRQKVEVEIPDSCDQCGRDLATVGFAFDACTIEGMMWSWMCPPCFFALGCGVGEGFGQLYFQEGGSTFLILGE